MEPMKFPGCNVCYGKEQQEYTHLPGNFSQSTGMLITKWKFSDEEIAEIVKNKVMFIGIQTFGKPLQPVLPTVYAMYHPGEEPTPCCEDCPNEETCVNNGCIKKQEEPKKEG